MSILHELIKDRTKDSLTVQWLGCCSLTARGQGLIPGWGTKIPLAAWCGQNKQTNKNKTNILYCFSLEDYESSRLL